MTDFSIGCRAADFEHENVFKGLDFVESSAATEWPPKTSTADKWKLTIPDDVGLVFISPAYLCRRPEKKPGRNLSGDRANYGELRDTDENNSLYERFRAFAVRMNAAAVLFETPPTIAPGEAGVRSLKRFFSGIDRAGMRIIWSPRGFWSIEDATVVARDNDLVLAVDPLMDNAPAGAFAYFRLGPFSSMKAQLGPDDTGLIIDRAAGFDEVWVSFATQQARKDAVNFKKTVKAL